MTGWKIDLIVEITKKKSKKLAFFLDNYPLCALNEAKDSIVIIRKYVFIGSPGKKIELRNGPPRKGEKGHWGIALAKSTGNGTGSVTNAVLPENLIYKHIRLEGETIVFETDEKTVATNFHEISAKLKLFTAYTEEEILQQFLLLSNVTDQPEPKSEKETITTKRFGVLKLDKEINSYIAEIEFQNKPLEIGFYNTTEALLDKNLKSAETILECYPDAEKQMIEDMLDLKNTDWREKGEKAISKSQFIKTVKLYAVNIMTDGKADFFYDAGDLFRGHGIITSVDENGGYLYSSI